MVFIYKKCVQGVFYFLTIAKNTLLLFYWPARVFFAKIYSDKQKTKLVAPNPTKNPS